METKTNATQNMTEEQLKEKYGGKLYRVGTTVPVDDDTQVEYTYHFKRPSVPSYDRYIKSASQVGITKASKVFMLDAVVDEDKERLEKDMEESFQYVPQLWGRAAADGTIPRLAALMDGEPRGMLGVCDGLDSSKYYIAVASSAPAGEGLEEYTVPAFTWAVFPGKGDTAAAIQELERRVVTEWLPTSGYEYAEGPDVEVYLDPECTRFEVWIPVAKAKG